jgi:nicotinate phosphoribosyltransferase
MSLLDTDFYIFTMMQAIFHRYTNVDTKFTFKWRNWEQMKLTITVEDFVGRLKKRIDALCEKRFTADELEYLSNIPFLKPDFIEYLRMFQLNRGYIHPYVHKEGEHVMPAIDFAGPLLNLIMFEVPVLAQVSELYTNNTTGMTGFTAGQEGMKRLDEKLDYLDAQLRPGLPFSFADFGTRRRAGVDHQRRVLERIIERCPQYLAGTSNVMFAKELGIKYIGTMAHLWFQIHQQLTQRLVDSQKAALQAWADEYRGELGIALSDTLGFDMFLCDFDRYFALLFDGARHDSGDPFDWGSRLIAHYKSLRINPMTKTAVWSDGLTFEVALRIFYKFYQDINTAFGIGTYLTNDCGFLAPQIVIKNTETNGKPTAKVADAVGKGMCLDDDFASYLMKVIKERVNGYY